MPRECRAVPSNVAERRAKSLGDADPCSFAGRSGSARPAEDPVPGGQFCHQCAPLVFQSLRALRVVVAARLIDLAGEILESLPVRGSRQVVQNLPGIPKGDGGVRRLGGAQ